MKSKPILNCEALKLTNDDMALPTIYRTSVPGGWLLYSGDSYVGAISFYPDPSHKWDGNSLS